MKATNSQDGIKRFMITIKIRIGRQDIIDCIGWQHITYGQEFPKTRREAIALVRDVRSKEGDSVWTWQEGDEVTPALWRSVASCVDELFPELSTAINVGYIKS